jgi:cytochrome c biogenesis protein CcmG, thiol:disulfide interchange protein DsbE
MTELDNLEFLDKPKPKNDNDGNKRLSKGSIVLLVGIIAVVMVLGLQLSRQNETQPTKGIAPDFYLELFDGSDFQLSDYKGQVVLINFWGSWCGPCRQEAPELQALYEDYQDEGFVIIGVNWLESSRQKALDFVDEFGITYPNGEDFGEMVAKKYHIQGAPENFLIDKDGNVSQFIYGIVQYNKLSGAIETLIAEQS